MKKKNRQIMWIIFSIILIVIIMLLFLRLTGLAILPVSNEIGKTNFCADSDGKLSLSDQSKIPGRVFWIHKEGKWSQINQITSTNDIPIWQLTYDDFCIDSSTLREKICLNDKVDSKIINCNCYLGRCL